MSNELNLNWILNFNSAIKQSITSGGWKPDSINSLMSLRTKRSQVQISTLVVRSKLFNYKILMVCREKPERQVSLMPFSPLLEMKDMTTKNKDLEKTDNLAMQIYKKQNEECSLFMLHFSGTFDHLPSLCINLVPFLLCPSKPSPSPSCAK
jgi:hypothetical protein